MNIAKILNELELSKTARPGELKCDKVNSPKDSVKEFSEFKGEGWVCTTVYDYIKRLTPEDDKDIKGLILCGERANGAKSIHIQKTEKGPEALILEEVSSNDEKKVILDKSMIAADGKGRLKYSVYYAEQKNSGINEIRPVSFRFTGFAE